MSRQVLWLSVCALVVFNPACAWVGGAKGTRDGHEDWLAARRASEERLHKCTALQESGEFGLCVEECESFLRDHPTGGLANAARMMIGRCQESAGRFDLAKVAYDRIVADIPYSFNARDAGLRIAWIERIAGAEQEYLAYLVAAREHDLSKRAAALRNLLFGTNNQEIAAQIKYELAETDIVQSRRFTWREFTPLLTAVIQEHPDSLAARSVANELLHRLRGAMGREKPTGSERDALLSETAKVFQWRIRNNPECAGATEDEVDRSWAFVSGDPMAPEILISRRVTLEGEARERVLLAVRDMEESLPAIKTRSAWSYVNALYQICRYNLGLGDIDAADALATRLGREFPKAELSAVAKYDVAQALIRSGKAREGTEMCREIVTRFPDAGITLLAYHIGFGFDSDKAGLLERTPR
jgi:tetratricopeptide (TPR) repeat protein